MAVPDFLNTAYRYKVTAAVVDVNTIISDLSAELVANGWTDASGIGTGPWTSPVRSDGAWFMITATRISATRIAWVVNDQNGLLVNNATDTRQDIDAGGTTIYYYTGPQHACVDSARATRETWWCAMLDRYPEALAIPRPIVIASGGPRNNAGATAAQGWDQNWLLEAGDTSYTLSPYHSGHRNPYGSTYDQITMSGALLFGPYEIQFEGWFFGRICQCLITDKGQAFGTELTVPIDTGVDGTFTVVGCTSNGALRMAFRRA